MDVKVTQSGTTTSPVTANGEVGLITTLSETLVAAATITFTVNNTGTDADSAVFVGITNYSGTTGTPLVRANNCVAGTSFDIIVTNAHASAALNGILTICFMIR